MRHTTEALIACPHSDHERDIDVYRTAYFCDGNADHQGTIEAVVTIDDHYLADTPRPWLWGWLPKEAT